MNPPVDRLLERLDRVKRSGGGGWTARCPAHEDRNPSLSIAEGDEGRVLVKCHAGCELAAIVAAVGLELGDLFPEPERGENGSRRIVSRYPYVDEEGELLFEAVRFSPKGFAQRRPDGSGGWVWNLQGARRVPFRLPQLREAVAAGLTVFVVEGEKDVLALEKLGFAATTNPMGAGKWRHEYAESLRGAGQVVIIPDDDEEGRAHALEVARSAVAVADDVRVVEICPRGESKADVSDWLAHAHNAAEREQAACLLREIVVQTPKVSIPPPLTLLKAGGNEIESGGELPFALLAPMLAQAPPEPPWSVRGYLAPFAITLLAGKPKVGKSTLVCALLAAVAGGKQFAGQDTTTSGVLLLTEERRDTLAEKARILGLIRIPPAAASPIGGGNESAPVHALQRHDAGGVSWPEIVRQAMAYCAQHKLTILVIDTFDRWTGLRGDAENAAGAVNEALEPLQYAAAAGLAVLLVSHQRKSTGEFGEAVRGSTALTGGVDVVVELERPAPSLALGKHARALRAVSRFSSTPDELYVELDEEAAAFVAIESPEEIKAGVEQTRIVEVLVGLDGATSAAVAEEVELPDSTVRRHLNVLLEREHVVREGQGKRGDPFRWRASEAGDEREAADRY